MKKFGFSVLLLAVSVLMNNVCCSACRGEKLEESIFSDTLLSGGSRTENRDPKVIKKYQKNFTENFDVIMTELKRIFESRSLKGGRGPNWFYNPISDEQFFKLKKIAEKLNADSKGSEFPNTKEFWSEYARLRPSSKNYSNGRLDELLKGEGVERHHIIPYFIGGTGDAINCIELLKDEHKVLHQVINKIIRNGSIE